ncbi:MAG TPA: DUF4331 family protein [Gemmatimonadales bacterium]|nr:DUF4331 family protein [Gemmatimonadales bacterium]
MRIISTRSIRHAALGLLALLAGLGTAACSDDSSGPSTPKTYNQIQRLGNPLISEVLLSKASHPKHGTTGPDTDPTTIGPEILSFITGDGSVAGRSESYANTLGSVLLPDVLVVQTDKDPATAGWLSWLPLAPFSNGWGGRKLPDDVTDLALLALFGDPFGADPAGAAGKEGLTTDHVAFDSQVLSTFPYVGNPN